MLRSGVIAKKVGMTRLFMEDGKQMQSLSVGEQALLDHVREHGGDAEVICIVRPRGASQADSEVFMLQNASPHFVERLSRVHEQGNVTSE